MRILFADDQNDIRLLTAGYLENAGHRVVAAANGKQALAALTGEAFDLILLDDDMPDLTGEEVLRAIRAEEGPARSLPAIALTGYDTDTDRNRLLRAGFDAVLCKPIRFQVLERALRAAADRRPLASAEPMPETASAPATIVDPLARMGGDAQLLRRAAQSMLRDLPSRLTRIRNAIRKKDAQALASGAHALGGSLAVFCADRAVIACKQLQALAQAANFADAPSTFAALQEAIAELQPNLRGYAGQNRTTGPGAFTLAKTNRRLPDSKRKKKP